MSSAVQVCWEKAARYFEVEEKCKLFFDSKYLMFGKESREEPGAGSQSLLLIDFSFPLKHSPINMLICWTDVYCTEDRYVIDPEETVNLVDENTMYATFFFFLRLELLTLVVRMVFNL
jgi:glutamate decarboxylase